MFDVIGLCAIGLEPVLANELRKLGFSLEKTSRGKVAFKTDAAGIAKAHIGSRVAERFLLSLATERVRDFDDLFECSRGISWETWVGKQDRLVVEKVRFTNATLKSVPSTQSILQKAAYERLCGTYRVNRMQETGRTVNVRIYVDGDRCSIGLDLTGDPLHARGYRKISGPAPIRETVAAGLILASGWKRKFPFYDPFCGTGTFPIEAAMYARNVAPGLERAFAFETMPAFSDAATETARREARKAIDTTNIVRISGSDVDKRSVETSVKNAISASCERDATFFHRAAEEARGEFGEGYIVTNPPYGQRLGDENSARELYRRMRHFKKNFAGWKLSVVTSCAWFPEEFDKEPSKVSDIRSGNEELKFFQFDL